MLNMYFWPFIYFLWKNVYSGLLPIFYFGYLCLLLTSWMNSLCILDINLLVQIIFPHSVGFLFTRWLFPLLCRSFVVWCSPIYFCCYCFGVRLKNHCQDLCQGAYCLFSSRSLMISGLMFKSLTPFWVHFCVWLKILVKFHYFACGGLIFPTPFLEETVLSPVCILGSFCHKLMDQRLRWCSSD